MVSDAIDFLVENAGYSILFVDDAPISIDLPASVEMKVMSRRRHSRGYSEQHAKTRYPRNWA